MKDMNDPKKKLLALAAELEDEENESQQEWCTNDAFCDYLSPDQVEMFLQMQELAEQKKKWLRIFDDMQQCIAKGDFDKAYTKFELLCLDLF